MLGGLSGHVVITELIEQGHVGEVAGEAPGGGAVQTGGGEGVEAQLGGAGVDVVGDGLQGLKVGDLVEGVAGLLQQSLVDDDAEGLVAVADGTAASPFSS